MSSPCPIAQCTLTFLPLHDMEAARDVLLGVLARGGAAAALVPGLVKDSLQASPNVVYPMCLCGVNEVGQPLSGARMRIFCRWGGAREA